MVQCPPQDPHGYSPVLVLSKFTSIVYHHFWNSIIDFKKIYNNEFNLKIVFTRIAMKVDIQLGTWCCWNKVELNHAMVAKKNEYYTVFFNIFEGILTKQHTTKCFISKFSHDQGNWYCLWSLKSNSNYVSWFLGWKSRQKQQQQLYWINHFVESRSIKGIAINGRCACIYGRWWNLWEWNRGIRGEMLFTVNLIENLHKKILYT